MEKKTIVAFDFDGTITVKDSFFRFIVFTKGRCRLLLGLLACSPFLVAFKLRLYSRQKAKEKLFSFFYKNTPVDEFNHWCESFTSEIDAMAKPEAIKAIKKYLNEKATVLIVSASIDTWIKPWAERAGVSAVLSTQAEVDENNRLTGKFHTKNCVRQEKVSRLTAAYPNRNEYTLTVYGNSRGDKELIEFADKGWYRYF